MLQRLGEWSEDVGVALDKEPLAAMRQFWRFVLDTNRHTNLTRITDDEAATLKHFVDSLTVLKTGVIGRGARLADIGTGAGFPGIPLKIARPDLRVTLIDSTLKRVRFLDEVIDSFGWNDVTAVHARAEQLVNNPKFTRKFDVVVARAVARLPRLVPLCMPFVRPGGCFVAMKGPDIEQETEEAKRELREAKATVESAHQFALPAGAGERTLVVIRRSATAG